MYLLSPSSSSPPLPLSSSLYFTNKPLLVIKTHMHDCLLTVLRPIVLLCQDELNYPSNLIPR